MDLRTKLEVLSDAAKYDASCASSGSKNAPPKGALGSTDGMGICHSYTPDGRCVSLLKVLLTNFCIYDCVYCVNRISSDTRRARFSVDELVQLTLDFYRRNYIEGLFLSSGVLKNADYTVELMVEVARKLRQEHRFFGYIHLKMVPGASRELLEKAGLFADRLSANVEMPTAKDLQKYAPQKTLDQVDQTMAIVRDKVDEAKEETARSARAPAFAPAGQSTQMLVGASPATDRELLGTADRLYSQHRLRRVYYSAYSPIPGSDVRLPARAPPLVREHRLYQADWLVRFYGFKVEEITTAAAPNLDLDLDPKLAWAMRCRELFPIDLNRAPRELLLRIPGLGVRTVDRIVRARRWHAVRIDDLRRLRVSLAKVQPFVITPDHRPTRLLERLERRQIAPRVQLGLFDSAEASR
jgi:putative DNA modification/repair radical SAM protein